MIGPDRASQHGRGKHNGESRVSACVAGREPPGFLQYAEQPFEAEATYPPGRGTDHARFNVQDSSNGNACTRRQPVAPRVQKTLAEWRADTNEENIGPRPRNICNDRLLATGEISVAPPDYTQRWRAGPQSSGRLGHNLRPGAEEVHTVIARGSTVKQLRIEVRSADPPRQGSPQEVPGQHQATTIYKDEVGSIVEPTEEAVITASNREPDILHADEMTAIVRADHRLDCIAGLRQCEAIEPASEEHYGPDSLTYSSRHS